MDLIFANNAISSLAGSITNTATVCQLQAGTGILFPQPVPGQYFVGTITDAATGLLNEIVWVTQVTGDTLTIQRGQEGTSPQAWSANDLFAELWTAGQAGAMLQQGQNQLQAGNYAVDTGVVNAVRVTLNPALANPVAGMPIRVKIANTNTGPTTLDPGPGPAPVVSVLGIPLTGGELQAGMVVEFFWNGATYNLQQPTVQGVPTGMLAPFAGNIAPAGWQVCNGQAISRTAFAALFTVIGIAYGGGDGVNTFNLPDFRGRVPAGLDPTGLRLTNATITGGAGTLGNNGGQQTESAGVAIPALGVSVSGGISGSTAGGMSGTGTTNGANETRSFNGGGNTGTPEFHTHNFTANVGGTLSVSGSFSGGGATGASGTNTNAVTNVQPTLIVNYIIKS